jgi:thioredoxin-like negative regulator of GroEL
MVAPELEKVAARSGGKFVIAKVNTEEDPHTGARHGVRSIPLLAVFKGGQELTRSAGARPAPQIEALIRQALAVHGSSPGARH